MGGVGAHIARAVVAACLGSAAGTPIAIAAMMVTGVPPSEVLEFAIPLVLTMLTFSLFFTLPSALLLAAPLTWPYRATIARHPLPAGLAYGAIGGGAGLAGLLSPSRRSARHDPARSARIYGAIFGAATGAAYVAELYCAGVRRTVAVQPVPPSESPAE